MEATALLYRLLMLEFILLGTQVQNIYTQKSDAALLVVTPNRLQHFQLESIAFECRGMDGSAQLRRIKSGKDTDVECGSIKKMPTGSSCTIYRAYPSDSGEYWCETEGGQKSNSVNITVTAGSVILESPVLTLMERDNVTLQCRSKTPIVNLQADFYKDDVLMESSPTGNMTIHNVNKPVEGIYKCIIPGAGESPGSWLAVIADSVILESPVLPVMEGNNVTLSCTKKQTSPILPADFYKDGLLFRSSSTGEMIIHRVSKSDDGLYTCRMSGAGESPESWLAVRADSVILESPVLPVMEGNNVTLSCRKKTSPILPADFYKDGHLIGSSSTGEMTIHRVSKSDEGLYKCRMSGAGESPESWLAVRALHRETCPFSDHSLYLLLLLRTVFTMLLVPLLLLLVGLLHCGKLRVTHK